MELITKYPLVLRKYPSHKLACPPAPKIETGVWTAKHLSASSPCRAGVPLKELLFPGTLFPVVLLTHEYGVFAHKKRKQQIIV